MIVTDGWKFRDINEYTFSLLINREIWFSTPNSFNDPFDCQAGIDETFEAIEKEIGVSFSKTMEFYKQELKSRLDSQTYGYFCLCQDWRNPLMWSHYSNCHRGIALGFSFSSESDINIRQLERNEVIYSQDAFKNAIKNLSDALAAIDQNYIKSKNFNEDQVESNKKILWNRVDEFYKVIDIMKSKDWHYEKEVRFEMELSSKDAKGEQRKFSYSDLQHVIFGIECDERNISTVRKLLNTDDWKHIKYWQARRDPVNLKVEADQIR